MTAKGSQKHLLSWPRWAKEGVGMQERVPEREVLLTGMTESSNAPRPREKAAIDLTIQFVVDAGSVEEAQA